MTYQLLHHATDCYVRPALQAVLDHHNSLCFFVVFGSLLSSLSSNSYQNGEAAVWPVPFLSIFNNLTNVHWLGPFKSPPPLNCHPTWHRNL